jgi:hypothetical protein
MSGSEVYRLGIFVLSIAMAVVGIALIAESLIAGGAILARVLLGVLFLAAGAGRLYMQRIHRSRGA